MTNRENEVLMLLPKDRQSAISTTALRSRVYGRQAVRQNVEKGQLAYLSRVLNKARRDGRAFYRVHGVGSGSTRCLSCLWWRAF